MAHWLRGRKENFRAAGIYLDLLNRSVSKAEKVTALSCLVDIYMDSGQYRRASEALEELSKLYSPPSPRPVSLLLNSATVALAEGEYERAMIIANTEQMQRERPREAAYTRGLGFSGRLRWSLARDAFSQVADQCQGEAAQKASPVCRLTWRNLVSLQRDPDRVSPALAVTLSAVLPGSGFLYTRHYFDAVMYAGSVGLGAFLTYDTAEFNKSITQQRASTYLLGALTLLLYTSNVLASYSSAQRLNEVRDHQRRQEVFAGARLPLESMLNEEPAKPSEAQGESAVHRLPHFCDSVFDNQSNRVMTLPDLAPPLRGSSSLVFGKGVRTWVNVWATWCEPCLRELPLLLKWREQLGRDEMELDLVLLSIDEDADQLERFLANHPEVPRANVVRVASSEAFEKWVKGYMNSPSPPIPIHLFGSRDGQLRCIRSGPLSAEDYPALESTLR